MAVEVNSIREPKRRLRRSTSAVASLNAGARLRDNLTQARRRSWLLRIMLLLPVVLLASIAVTLTCFYISYSKIVDARLASGYLTSRAGIYAAPRVLQIGQSFSRARLVEALRRAGYVEAEASDVWSGRFEVKDDGVLIRPRRMAGAASSPEEVRVRFDRRERITSIDGDGEPLGFYTLEPETLTNDTGMKTSKRAALSYNDLPTQLVHAILAIEDRRFFEHRGVDPTGVARALWSWVADSNNGDGGQGGANEAHRQGGSTITQQLVKNTYLTPERTLRRKFNEAILAAVLERRLSKEDILALYCNEVYLGQRGGAAVRGVGQAARVYFGKELRDLSLAEAATIAGMIQSPARYAPDRHPEKAAERRDTVVRAMLGEGFISSEEAEAATSQAVAVAPLAATDQTTAPYFIDYVNRTVEARLDASRESDERALRVYTTIDLELQQLAESAVGAQLARLEQLYKGRKHPQAALVALDPHTGAVLAMVGGKRYTDSQLNRVTDARRQPGSVFKPFVYAAALESGISPVSLYADAPRAFQYDLRSTYRPANYGDAYSMRDVTMRTGLVRSLNVVTVDLALRAGLSRVAGLAESFGLPKPEAYPSLALGTTEATPLQIASAYTAFATGGQLVRPTVIERVADSEHGELAEAPQATQQVIRPSTAYMMTDMLSAVIDHGTARAARGALKGTAIAGKTGTSRDGWFAGYTPNLVCVVWVGFDDGSQLGLTGAESALPAWVEFVRGAVALRPELGGASFERPAGINTVEIDPETGMLASPSCPQRERIAVTPTLAPGAECYLHSHVNTELAYADNSQLYDANAATITTTATNEASVTAATTVRVAPAATTANAARHATAAAADDIYAAMPDSRALKLKSASTQARESLSAAPRAVPATQIVTGRNGRPTLTNTLRALPSGGLNQ